MSINREAIPPLGAVVWARIVYENFDVAVEVMVVTPTVTGERRFGETPNTVVGSRRRRARTSQCGFASNNIPAENSAPVR